MYTNNVTVHNAMHLLQNSLIEKRVPIFCHSPPIKEKETSAAKLKTSKLRNFNSFNLLAASLKNLERVSFQTFKGNRDNFMSLVPDEPMIDGYRRR